MATPNPLYLFVGRIASGKETQARLLAEKLGCEVFTTGDRFREMARSGTPLGKKIKIDYEKGLLMPAWVAVYFFQDFIFKLPADHSAVFEGTGRAEPEARMVEEVCAWLGRPYTVFNLEVGEEEVVRRALARKRDAIDNDEAIIRARLDEYDKRTAPAIEYFRSIGKVIEINGEQPVELIHEAVMAHVDMK